MVSSCLNKKTLSRTMKETYQDEDYWRNEAIMEGRIFHSIFQVCLQLAFSLESWGMMSNFSIKLEFVYRPQVMSLPRNIRLIM